MFFKQCDKPLKKKKQRFLIMYFPSIMAFKACTKAFTELITIFFQ